MPWRTAKKMICQPSDGLIIKWNGRVWCNPPYSDMLRWAEKMVEHGNGIMRIQGRPTDTRWCQLLFAHCDAAYFLAGRLLFHYADGRKSEGKWCNNILLAYGSMNAKFLLELGRNGIFPGLLFKRQD
jgi:hypothetical protein